MRSKYYLIGAIVVVFLAIIWFTFFHKTESAMSKFVSGRPVATGQRISSSDVNTFNLPERFCPSSESLVKQKNLKWGTPDNKWEGDAPSSATKILSFIGAQWIGVKVGKIICLYHSDEAVAFPVALEAVRSFAVLEPRTLGWSTLVGNRRFCKSASVADCSYFYESPKDVRDIYKEIEYAPDKNIILDR